MIAESKTPAGVSEPMPAFGAETPGSEPGIVGMRVALVSGNEGIGGAERQCLLLASELERLGAVVKIYFQDRPFRYRRSETLDFSRFPTRHLCCGPFSRLGFVGRRLNRLYFGWLLRAARIQVVDCFNFDDTFTLFGLEAAKAAGIKAVVGGVRNTDFVYDAGFQQRLREASKLCAGMTCNSQAGAGRLISLGIIAPERLWVIENGIEVPSAESGRAGSLGREPQVLFAGHLKAVKGPLCFVESALRVLGAGRQCRFVMAGDGDLRGQVQAAVRAAGALPSFELLGLVRPGAVPYAQARVLVSTSLSEGSSNSILEALAHGTPVVATAVGAASEVLEGQPFATLVKPQDPASVAAAIDYWLRLSPSEWEAASTCARKYVQDHFSVPKMAARYCAFYRWAMREAHSSAETPAAAISRGEFPAHAPSADCLTAPKK